MCTDTFGPGTDKGTPPPSRAGVSLDAQSSPFTPPCTEIRTCIFFDNALGYFFGTPGTLDGSRDLKRSLHPSITKPRRQYQCNAIFNTFLVFCLFRLFFSSDKNIFPSDRSHKCRIFFSLHSHDNSHLSFLFKGDTLGAVSRSEGPNVPPSHPFCPLTNQIGPPVLRRRPFLGLHKSLLFPS